MRGQRLSRGHFYTQWLNIVLWVMLWCRAPAGARSPYRSHPSCPPKGYDNNDLGPCKCRLSNEDYLQVWCSGTDLEGLNRGLASVAAWRGTAPVDELVVEGGALTGLPGRAFAPLRVRRLLMHRSGLERMSAAALVGLEESLVELMLVEPRLRSLPFDLLDPLPRLEALTIDATENGDGSSLVDGGDAFPGRPLLVPLLRSLPSLRYLRISAPPSSGLGGIFPPLDPSAVSLPALLSLSIYGGWTKDGSKETEDALWSAISFLAGCCGGLEELLMAGNGLRLGKRLPSNSDSPRQDASLRSLRILDLSDNPLGLSGDRDLSDGSIAEDTELGLSSLGNLPPQWLLDGAPNWIFPSLTEIRADRASLFVLPEGALRSLSRLERLSLEGNSMRHIGPDAFADLPALHELRLRDNLLSEESMPPPPYRRRLPWTLPALKGLDLSKNILRGGTALRRLLSGVPSVRRLDLSDNAIGSLAEDAFAATPLLEFLDLSGNPVLKAPLRHPSPSRLTFLKPLSRLYELRISGESFLEDLPAEPRTVRRLRPYGTSSISTFPSLPPLPGVEVLVVSGVAISRLYSSSSSSPPPFSAALLPRLTSLDLSSNSLTSLEPGAFSGVTSSLSSVDLSRNRLSGVLRLGPPLPMKSLERLDVSENRLEAISAVSSASLPELKVLNASGNGIPSLEMALPDALGSSLEVVDLSRNALVSLPEGPLKAYVALTELWLDGNDICVISGRPFDSSPRLRVLSLRHNRIATLSPDPFQSLLLSFTAYSAASAATSDISSRRRTLLRLEGNPLSCSCSLLWLQEWLKEAEQEEEVAGDVGDEEWQRGGPRCKDGTPVRNIRLERKECHRSSSALSPLPPSGNSGRKLEQIADTNSEEKDTGGEEDTCAHVSQDELSPLQELSGHPAQQHPSPEESEYFYDQYVDEIHPGGTPSSGPVKHALEDTRNESSEALSTTEDASTSTPVKEDDESEHHGGEAQTAQTGSTRKNETSPGNEHGIAGMSIFGIPIPSWSLSGLFGSGKKRGEGGAKVGRGNDHSGRSAGGAGGRGRVYGDHKVSSPANRPKLESGFKPIFPGSGGFVPIAGNSRPSFSIETNTSKDESASVHFTSASVPNRSLSRDAPRGSTANPSLENHSGTDQGKIKKTLLPNTIEDITTVQIPTNRDIKYEGSAREKHKQGREPAEVVASSVSGENVRKFQSKWSGGRVIGTVERVELKKNVGVEVGSFNAGGIKNSVGKAIMVSGETIGLSEGVEASSGRGERAKNVPEIITVKGETIEEAIGTKPTIGAVTPSYPSTSSKVFDLSFPNPWEDALKTVPSKSTQTSQQRLSYVATSEGSNVTKFEGSTTPATTVNNSEIPDRAMEPVKNRSASQLLSKETPAKPPSSPGQQQGTPLSSYLLAPGGQAKVIKVSKTSASQRHRHYHSGVEKPPGEGQSEASRPPHLELQKEREEDEDRLPGIAGNGGWPSTERQSNNRYRLPEWYYANYNSTEATYERDIIVTRGYDPSFPPPSISSSHRLSSAWLLLIKMADIWIR